MDRPPVHDCEKKPPEHPKARPEVGMGGKEKKRGKGGLQGGVSNGLE